MNQDEFEESFSSLTSDVEQIKDNQQTLADTQSALVERLGDSEGEEKEDDEPTVEERLETLETRFEETFGDEGMDALVERFAEKVDTGDDEPDADEPTVEDLQKALDDVKESQEDVGDALAVVLGGIDQIAKADGGSQQDLSLSLEDIDEETLQELADADGEMEKRRQKSSIFGGGLVEG